jgi:hypothetical protein
MPTPRQRALVRQSNVTERPCLPCNQTTGKSSANSQGRTSSPDQQHDQAYARRYPRSNVNASPNLSSIRPDTVDLHDFGSLEQSFHSGHIVQGLSFVQPPLDLRLLCHPSFGVTNCCFNVSRRNDHDAIRVPDYHVTGIDGGARHHNRNMRRDLACRNRTPRHERQSSETLSR